VEYRITDAQGRTLLTMPLGAQTAGEHTVEWNGKAADGSPCSTGTYFLSILVNAQRYQTISLVKQP
jgi:flagellar basal-body rod modification protein FlgD